MIKVKDTFTFLIFICIFLYSIAQLIIIWNSQQNDKKAVQLAQELYMESIETQEQASQHVSRIHSLKELNPDIVGWLHIEGTKIDYPIVQAKDNAYYLQRNYVKETSKAGSIFMDFRNDRSGNNKHTILYGHRMKNGKMFGELDKFLDAEFFYTSPAISLETLENTYFVEVFSVYITTTDNYYIQTDFTTEEEYEAFLKKIQAQSQYQVNANLTADSQIITFSTCDYTLDSQKGRLVVHGILIGKK